MTRKELVDHWAESVIPAVFRAEDKLRDKLKQVLSQHKDDPTTAAEVYTHIIAEEIISKLTDEQISKM